MKGFKGFFCKFTVSLSGIGLSVACSAASIFSYSSNAGDYIGQGKSAVLTDANAKFGMSGNKDRLTFTADGASGEYWYIRIAAPVGSVLAPGTYANAERSAFKTGRSPGLDVSSTGRGCNEIWGKVTVRQISFDAAGNVDKLEATFLQRCEQSKAPALAGIISYNAPPLSLKLTSGSDDYVGGGVGKMYYNDTSIFVLDGNASYLRYSASGLRDDWYASIAAPVGKTLVPGRYPTRRFADGTHAGLDFTGNGRGCNENRGTLNVRAIEKDAQANVVKLYADFEQYCDNRTTPLRGTIHFGI
ncbi:hypothetical protein [Xanthomonas sp. BRIP62411]|uniref:hypothetical protein n=1 Tax=Xanthomonas sp. BRIP62411 TaxID=2182389 RepID=UPI001F49D8D5|nr:hypothetical protein [Xanthomonas sp. BRIP62411]